MANEDSITRLEIGFWACLIMSQVVEAAWAMWFWLGWAVLHAVVKLIYKRVS